ncbi:MAG TPA: thiamine pyrophosphate-dependent enzyme [Polyangiaceae bacterium]
MTGSSSLERSLGLREVLAADGAVVEGAREFSVELAASLYRHMRRVRRVDERFAMLQRQGRIGFHGSCTGQEAPPVAAALALAPTDWVFPALRESALLLTRGFPLGALLAQAFGNRLDNTKGRQMPSHAASRAFRYVSWSSAIGTQLPHAVGAALAAKRRRSEEVMLAFLGDGATSHPDFHAALNFSGVFRAPVVFVCQNNGYAISVSTARQTASKTFAVKAHAYGVSADRVDGNDALAVFACLSDAIAEARRGAGPSFVECVTYRMGPHSSSDDPSRYRSAAEVEAFARKDPIARLGRHLMARKAWSAADDERLDLEIDAEFDRELARVEGAGPPERDSLFDDVYSTLPWHLVEQREECRSAVRHVSAVCTGSDEAAPLGNRQE